MENLDTQTHDFMNVESLSPLPVIHHSPPNDNLIIRLFGKEFGGGDPATITTNEFNAAAAATVINEETQENGENHRKFECQICGRNLPTSQALGGHQNAHRRERLQAKQTHFQPVTVPHSSSKPQLHNFLNRHRHHHHHHHLSTTAVPPYNHQYPSIKHFGTSRQTPINSTPLPPWRFPTMVQNLATLNRGGLLNSSNTRSRSSSLSLYTHEGDQVSLDLHL